MIKALIGKKLGMTTIFDNDGLEIPVTLLEMGPCTVVQVKKADGPDGYNSVQVGYDPVKLQKMTNPMRGHYEKKGLKEGFRVLKEFVVDSTEELESGRMITADELFQENTKVKITGTSKGKGFAGAMKRHGFSGAPASHGASKVHRKPMSAGATDAQRVFKGKRSPGHMGNEQVTLKNLEIVKIKPLDGAVIPQQEPEPQTPETPEMQEGQVQDQQVEQQEKKKDKKKEAKGTGATKYLVAIRGSVPGAKNSLVVLENLS